MIDSFKLADEIEDAAMPCIRWDNGAPFSVEAKELILAALRHKYLVPNEAQKEIKK